MICVPCPTRRRPRSSLPCRGLGPTAEATSVAAARTARKRRTRVARLHSDGRAPSPCASPNSLPARRRRPGRADRFRPRGRSFSRPSYRPRLSWPRSGSRPAPARFGARSGGCQGRSLPASPRRPAPSAAPPRPLHRTAPRPRARPPAGELDIHPAVQPSGRSPAGGRRGTHLRSCTAGANRPQAGGRSAPEARARQLTP